MMPQTLSGVQLATLTLAAIFAAGIVSAAAIMTFVIVYRTRRRTTARELILNYLQDRGYTMISFERIRSNIKGDYTDSFLESLPEYFPTKLRRAKLKGGRSGLARIKSKPLPPIEEDAPGEVSAG